MPVVVGEGRQGEVLNCKFFFFLIQIQSYLGLSISYSANFGMLYSSGKLYTSSKLSNLTS